MQNINFYNITQELNQKLHQKHTIHDFSKFIMDRCFCTLISQAIENIMK